MTVADIGRVEPFNAGIGRSTMITTEIPGAAATDISGPALAAWIIERACADLAIINQIPASASSAAATAAGRYGTNLRSTKNSWSRSAAALARPARIPVRPDPHRPRTSRRP